MTDAPYRFRPVTEADMPMLADWLATPEVARWFEEGPAYVDTLRAHLTDWRISMRIVLLGDTPIAYLQHYRVHAWEDHPLGFLPDGARGLDTFIGQSGLMRQGHGPAYMRAIAQALFDEGVPALGIDPHPENRAAIRAYAKAGFLPSHSSKTPWGAALLMTCRPGAFDRASPLPEAQATRIEEHMADMQRVIDDLSTTVARQDAELTLLTSRVQLLLTREADREAEGSGGVVLGTERPPHW